MSAVSCHFIRFLSVLLMAGEEHPLRWACLSLLIIPFEFLPLWMSAAIARPLHTGWEMLWCRSSLNVPLFLSFSRNLSKHLLHSFRGEKVGAHLPRNSNFRETVHSQLIINGRGAFKLSKEVSREPKYIIKVSSNPAKGRDQVAVSPQDRF